MSSPFPMFGSQDLKDDDGQVIDSFLKETDAPPDLTLATEPIPKPALKQPVPKDRLLSGTLTLQSGANAYPSPIMLFPADEYRESVIVSVFSTAALPNATTEGVTVADELGKCNSALAFTIRPGKDPYTLINYNGALFVQALSGITASIEVTWCAIRKGV